MRHYGDELPEKEVRERCERQAKKVHELTAELGRVRVNWQKLKARIGLIDSLIAKSTVAEWMRDIEKGGAR